MMISLRKTERYYMQCFIIFAFILFLFVKYLFHMNIPYCYNLVKTASYHLRQDV